MVVHPPDPGYLFWESEQCYVNLAGDYDYLTNGYYLSQELELAGRPVHPTCREILDAYVAPLFLEKARQAGLDILPYYITSGFFEPPVLIDTMNPFMNRQKIVRSPEQVERSARSLTRNYTYAICCQELPAGSRVRHFRALLGWCTLPLYRDLARTVWRIFRIPIARVRVVEPAGGAPLLSGLWPLPYGTLPQRERARLQEILSWPI
jgi:hypothetical protein